MELDLNLKFEERTTLKRIDWSFILLILALNIVGLINLYSATHGPQSEAMNGLFLNQIIWLAIGWSIFFIVTFIDYQIVTRLAYIFYFINLLALLYVTFFGHIALGAQRWINFGFFKYQPSETMKLAMIFVLARTLQFRSTEGAGQGLKQLLWPVILILLPFALVFHQPDLGTAMMLTIISCTMIVFMKLHRWIIIGAITAGIVALPIAWKYGLRDYQKHRITNFLTPDNDPRGTGYNSIQSKIAVGSGKILGKGFRKGTQSQLEFLPERHTDFIFSVLSEEHGFLGSITTLSLFCMLFLIMIRIASTARDKFGSLLTVGVLAYVFWHMFINMGMVIGLLPIVGVPLPLLSYGGSGMLTTMLGMGLVSSVAFRRYIF